MSELYQVNGTTYTLTQIEEIAIKAIQEGGTYLDGAQAACSWLEEVYGEGIRETDAWGTYMDEEEAE
jgi:hypothetical protein